MEDPRKKIPGEEEEKKPEAPEKENPVKSDEPKEGEAPDDKQPDENGEGAKAEDVPKEEPKPEEKPPEPTADPRDEEILRLKTQIAAMQLGVKPECVEDATVVAENYVKSGKCKDINSALSEVVKKYPDMKADGKAGEKNGFKVGAGSQKTGEKADDTKLSKAFGIKKKG